MTDPIPAKPKGKARKWSDEEIALLILLLAVDLEDARQLWVSYAGSLYAGLIDAEAFENRDALVGNPGFWFDIERQQYAVGRRGYISQTTLRKVTESVRVRAQADATILAAQAAAGAIELPQFQNQMVDLLKPLAVAVTGIARGGIQQIVAADETAVGEKLTTQFTALRRFAQQIEAQAPQADEPGVIVRRSRAYADDAMLMLPDRRAYSHKLVGFTEEQNVLGVAEHCKRDPLRPWVETCPEQTEAGWVPIGSLAKIGERRCLWNCRCEIQYRRAVIEERGVA